MKKILQTILLISLTLGITACTKEEKKKEEVKYTASLPMPEWDEEKSKRIWNVYKNWHTAKNDPIPATKIGYAYADKLKDHEKALEWFKYADSMVSFGENSYFACYSLNKLKQYDEAITWCKKAVEQNWDKALLELGDVYLNKLDYNESIVWFKKSFEKTKDNISANALGYAYSDIKKFKEAEKWYKEAIKLDNYEAYKNIAILYNKNLKDDIKAAAYSIAVINTKYRKGSVLKLLKETWKIPNETIKKGYELQLNSPDFPVKYDGNLGLE